MKTSVQLGSNERFELLNAILIYGAGGNSDARFATIHATRNEEGAPYLAEGEPLSVDFLRTLADGLGKSLAPEILPANVLARTAEMIVWWSGARHRTMYFDNKPEHQRFSGRTYPHPPLVWKLEGHLLSVRALPVDERPQSTAKLRVAPYFNVDNNGVVCLGSMKVPAATTIENFERWEASFFASEFTHPNGTRKICTHRSGYLEMLNWLMYSDHFPASYLVDAKQTLRQFVTEKGR